MLKSNVYGYLKTKDLLVALFDKSFGFDMIRKPKYRGKHGKMLNCSQFEELKVAKKEIVNCDKKENQIKKQPATINETSKSQR